MHPMTTLEIWAGSFVLENHLEAEVCSRPAGGLRLGLRHRRSARNQDSFHGRHPSFQLRSRLRPLRLFGRQRLCIPLHPAIPLNHGILGYGLAIILQPDVCKALAWLQACYYYLLVCSALQGLVEQYFAIFKSCHLQSCCHSFTVAVCLY